MPAEPLTWRELQRFERKHDAEQLQARLVAAGIAATIPDLRVMGVHPSCRLGADDVRVLVAVADYDRARQLLTTA